MIIEQRIGRVQRLGSSFNEVVVFNPYAEGTIEEVIVCRLLAKLDAISQAIGDIESVLECCENGDEEKIEKSIAELVLRSLKKQDCEEQCLKIDLNIKNGLAVYEESRRQIEETCCTTNWEDEFSPKNRPPRIPPQAHFMSATDFVRHTQSETEPSAFSDELLADPVSLQDSKEFKNLVDKWRRRASSFVWKVQTRNEEKIIEEVSAMWKEKFPAAPVSEIVQVGTPQWIFNGNFLVKAEISNAVDRLQKVFSVPVRTLPEAITQRAEFSPLPPETSETSENFIWSHDSRSSFPEIKANSIVQQAILANSEMTQFADFYDRRVSEKQENIKNQLIKQKIQHDYGPNFSAEVNGIRGLCCEKMTRRVFYTIQEHPYTFDVTYIPLFRYFIPIQTGKCDILGETFPESVLETCEETGKRAASHLLVTLPNQKRVLKSETEICGFCCTRGLKREMEESPIFHQLEHISHKIRCEYSLQLGFPEEMEKSDFSGKMVLSKYLRSSEKSGRKGAPNEFSVCTRTGKMLLNDEVKIRSKDRLLYDSDLFALSALSGKEELREFLVECEVSHTLVLPEERVECAVSHKKIRRDWTSVSPISQRIFETSIGIHSKDGLFLPPDEVCPICSKAIRKTENKIRTH